MNATQLEITATGEVIFGDYPDGNILVKNDPECLATAREQLTNSIECLDAFVESPPAIGQEV